MAHQPLCTCACHDITQLKSQITNQHSHMDVLSTLDQHIATLEAQVLSIKALRNHYTPIATLSTEILADILTEAVKPIDRFKPQSWLAHVELTRVCRLWRGVAMDCAAFWSCIPLQGHHMEEMLARSKQYPFSVRATAKSTALPISWDPASTNIRAIVTPRRLRELHLAGDWHHIPELLNSVPENLLALESLDIQWPGSLWPVLLVPAHILTAPKLRHLRLVNCSVLWDSITTTHPILHQLRTLSIEFSSLNPIGRIIGHHLLLDILTDSSPHLESLQLVGTIGPDHPLSSSEERIPLPHLKELYIVDRPSRIARLLSHITVPSTVSIDLSDEDVDGSQPDVQDAQTTMETFRSLFRSCGLGDTGFGIRRQSDRMHIQLETEEGFTRIQMALSVTDGSHPESEDFGPGRRTFGLMTTQRSEHASILLDHLHVQQLDNLDIAFESDSENDYDQLDTSTWISFFKRHPSIRRLSLSGPGIANVAAALGNTSTGSPDAPNAHSEATPPDLLVTALPLPLLQLLRLQGVRFNRRTPLGQSNYTSLKEALAARQYRGLTITRIDNLYCPNFTTQMMKELERLNGAGTVIRSQFS